MKKVLLSLSLVAAVAISANAVDLGNYDVNVKAGATFDNLQLFSSDNDGRHKTALNLGVSVYKPIMNKLSVGMDLDGSFPSDYQSYSLGLGAKYNVMSKLNVLGGISYNIFNVDHVIENAEGFGIYTEVNYEIYKNMGVYAKYNYYDLRKNGNIDAVSTGIFYRF